MGDKYFILEDLVYLFSHGLKPWRPGHHAICNAGHGLYIIRNWLAGINKRFKFFHYFVAIEYVNGDFRDSISSGIPTRSFYINNSIHEQDS